MTTQNDYSLTNWALYKGNEFTSVITGNGLTSFQGDALSMIETIVRNAGYPNYRLPTVKFLGPGALTNSRLFYDADSVVPQTVLPSEAVLLAFLLQDGVRNNGDGSGAITVPAQITLITAIAKKAFPMYNKASSFLDSTVAEELCGVDGSGRYEACSDMCVFKLNVAIF
jgi:hypothetical protein